MIFENEGFEPHEWRNLFHGQFIPCAGDIQFFIL